MTGRYPIRHGLQVGVVRPWAQYGLPLEEQTLPEGLKTAGYATAIVGKWHLGHFAADYLPTRRGFDHQYGHYNGAIDYNTHIRDGGFDWHRDDRPCNDEGYSTHLLANEAVSIVERYAGKKPFLLYVPFNAVHSPHQVPQEYLAPFQHLEGQRKLYAGMLTAMDEAVGKIVAAIDASGQRDNTLFLFNSDNGGPNPGKVTSNGKLRAGKGTHYEGGVRVAAFATWKGHIPEGSTVSEPIHVADWYPTLLRLTGANVDQRLPLDGRDVWDSITDGKPIPDRELLINATPSAGALRQGNWKLVVTGPATREEQEDEEAPAAKGKMQIQLFDLAADPYEEKNLAAQNSDVANKMLARWREYQKEAVPIKIRPKPKAFVTPKIWGDHLTPTSSDPAALQTAAPFFAALDDSGKYWKSNEHVGKKTIVVYFYPADMTGGCTKQACSYRDAAAELSKLNVEVIGISGDSVENHQAFKKLHGLNFTLLADTDGKIAESFGVPVTRESKKVVAKVEDKELTLLRDVTTKRWTFVIDPAGTILYRNTEVTAVEDCRNVIDVIANSLKNR
jgi:arylsulfatase A-like enzyme/peroxiredoxin